MTVETNIDVFDLTNIADLRTEVRNKMNCYEYAGDEGCLPIV